MCRDSSKACPWMCATPLAGRAAVTPWSVLGLAVARIRAVDSVPGGARGRLAGRVGREELNLSGAQDGTWGMERGRGEQ